MEIGAPTGVVKKTPEEIREMLRGLGMNIEDLPSNSSGDPSSPIRARTAAVGGEEIAVVAAADGESEVKRGKRADSAASGSTTSSTSTHTITNTTAPVVALSANQRGKLPARSDSPSSTSDTPTIVQEQGEKPVGWYTTASLDEIRATLPRVREEDLIPSEEIPDALAQLERDFGVLRDVADWRSRQLDREIEELAEAHSKKVGGDGDAGEGEEENEDEDDDGNEDGYVWGEFGEPDPRYVDSGWCQEEVSSAGVGQRWFMFDDAENVLGGPKCPITHPGDGFEFGEVVAEGDTTEVGTTGQEQTIDATEIDQSAVQMAQPTVQMAQPTIRLVNTDIDDRFADADEDLDEDAHQLTSIEILRRDGLL